MGLLIIRLLRPPLKFVVDLNVCGAPDLARRET